MSSFFRKLRWWAQRRDKEAELREELRFHLEEEAEEKQERGLSESEAGRAALSSSGTSLWSRRALVLSGGGLDRSKLRAMPVTGCARSAAIQRFRLSPSRHWRSASAALRRCSAPFIRC